MKVAITGGIGSGKSLVLQIIESLGFNVVSTDKISAELTSDENVLKELKNLFPDCVDVVENKYSLNKPALSDTVFNNKENLAKLNGFLHPLIMKATLDRLENGGFAEVPLLFEGGFENLFDNVIVVVRDKNTRISAVEKRSGLSTKQVLERMNNQIDYDATDFSRYVILKNDGDLQELKSRVLEILDELDIKV